MRVMNPEDLLGKLVMVGLSRVDASGRRIAQTQFHGRVARLSNEDGLVLVLPNGGEYRLSGVN